jgi:hypothetical protein
VIWLTGWEAARDDARGRGLDRQDLHWQLDHGAGRDADQHRAGYRADLVAAIQTGSRDRGRAMADQLDTGIVHVNDQTLNNDAYAPFGGTRASGNGARFGSQSSWDEFTQWRWVTVRDQARGFPF